MQKQRLQNILSDEVMEKINERNKSNVPFTEEEKAYRLKLYEELSKNDGIMSDEYGDGSDEFYTHDGKDSKAPKRIP